MFQWVGNNGLETFCWKHVVGIKHWIGMDSKSLILYFEFWNGMVPVIAYIFGICYRYQNSKKSNVLDLLDLTIGVKYK